MISREHFISETLLRYLNRDNSLNVHGFPWAQRGSKIVSPNALASKILCDRHNSALSPLDASAVRLFQSFDEANAQKSEQPLLHLFNGHDVERWLLKILCGLLASKSFSHVSGIDQSIPQNWLDILFGREDFSDEQGLYICKNRGHWFEGPYGLKMAMIANDRQVTGVAVVVCGYELILSMSGLKNRKFDGRDFAFRPFEIHARREGFEKSIIFTWDGPADLKTLSVLI